MISTASVERGTVWWGFNLLRADLIVRRLAPRHPPPGPSMQITYLIPAELRVIIRDQGCEAAAEPVRHVRRGSVENEISNPFLWTALLKC